MSYLCRANRTSPTLAARYRESVVRGRCWLYFSHPVTVSDFVNVTSIAQFQTVGSDPVCAFRLKTLELQHLLYAAVF